MLITQDTPLYSLSVGQFQNLLSSLLPKEEATPQPQDDKMSIKELASYLKVSVTTIHNMRKAGRIRFYGSRRLTYFFKNEVDADLASNPVKRR